MRVLFIQRSLTPPGGGNAVAAWMLHALAGHHQVETLTLGDWSPARTNAFYGTAIPDTIPRHMVPQPWRLLGRQPDGHGYRLRMAGLFRQARSLGRRYDLLITADDYGAFEQPGIQYVHFPAALNPVPTRFPWMVGAYFRLCDLAIGVPWSRAAGNLTLANSCWTAERLRGLGATRVLYPPVVDTGPGEPWDARPNTFLCIGRFHQSKRLEVVLSIIRRLRAQALPDARLVFAGSPVDAAYTRRIKQAAARLGEWVAFREDLSRTALNALMGRCRYGVHAMADEHFGMATAEMSRAGCLVFPHASGGSIEVVDGAGELLWRTEDEAVARIAAAARDAVAGGRLRQRLRHHGEIFSTERFVREVREIVAAWPAVR